ncbi:hypothetical protein BOX15_Mlig011743g1, partial [Macrostomum lignano]
ALTMGKKVKTGKSRRDKFYHLAKESGYRSRAAFKLLQLNRKFAFLQQSRVVIDLCAAPGGWLQVVRECAPVSGLVIGVDLVPIRPVPNVKTLVADITTSECRALLRKELQHLKADCVLHDGAPNVGTDWGYDEFAQASLCHQALLLATDFLRRGGTFVTKVFRSADYEKLKFVLLQLFKGVRAAKPEASRLESAEIYLICQGYKAPDQLDPAFRDITKVFGDVAVPAKPAVLSRTFGPVKKQKAQGYTELDGKLVDLPVSRFLSSEEPLQLLASCGRVVFDLPEVEQMASPELIACCKDIKVLGKAEVAALLQWRRRLLERLRRSEEQLAAAKPAATAAAGAAAATPDDVTIAEAAEDAEMQKVDQLVSKVAREEQLSAKKKAKKTREAKKRLVKRIQLSMVHQGDTIEQSDDVDLFSLARVRRLLDTEAPAPDVVDEAEAVDPTAASSKNSRLRYHSRDAGANIEGSAALVEPRTKRPRLPAATSRVGDDADDPDSLDDDDDEENASSSNDDESDHSVEDADDDCDAQNPLLTDLEDPAVRRKRRADSWFAQPAFAELEAPTQSKANGDEQNERHLFEKRWSDDEDDDGALPAASGKDVSNASDSESDIDKQPEKQQVKSKKQRKREQREQQLTTPEELAIATRIATSRRQRREIVESGFHRFMFNDDNLPAWFVADEKRHMRPSGIRLPKSELDPHAKRLRGVNVRTVKKVVEAKARKKMKAARRLEKVRKRAESVLEQEGVVDAEKTMQVRQLYKRSGVLARKKRPVVYAVSKRSGAVSRKQAAGKGSIVKRVDPRLKKDKRSAGAKGKSRGKKNSNNNKQRKR